MLLVTKSILLKLSALGSEPLDDPSGIFLAVAEAVVQAVGAALPEFDPL